MTELFPNISQLIRDYAALVWEQAKQLSPNNAAKLINAAIEEFDKEGLKNEADFLRFYFNLQMEMMKE